MVRLIFLVLLIMPSLAHAWLTGGTTHENYFCSSAAALSAMEAFRDYNISQGNTMGWGYYLTETDTGQQYAPAPDTTLFKWWGATCTYPTWKHSYYYLYPINPTQPNQDTDGDGLVDDLDPTPDHYGETQYYYKVRAYDNLGTLLYAEVVFGNDSNQIVGTQLYGDKLRYNTILNGMEDGTILKSDPGPDPFNNAFFTKYSTGQLETDFGEYQDCETEIVVHPYTGDEQPFDIPDPVNDSDGVTDPGSQTATEEKDYSGQLGAMIQNQNAQIENQKNQGIRTNITNELLGEISSKIGNLQVQGSGFEGLTQEDVESALGNHAANQDSLAESEQAEQEGILDSATPIFDGNFTEEDKPTENTIEQVYNGFLQNNAVTSYLNDSSVSISDPLCSMSWDYNGHSIVLTMCDYQSQVQSWGGVMAALSGLVSLLIVFKR